MTAAFESHHLWTVLIAALRLIGFLMIIQDLGQSVQLRNTALLAVCQSLGSQMKHFKMMNTIELCLGMPSKMCPFCYKAKKKKNIWLSNELWSGWTYMFILYIKMLSMLLSRQSENHFCVQKSGRHASGLFHIHTGMCQELRSHLTFLWLFYVFIIILNMCMVLSENGNCFTCTVLSWCNS